MNRLAPLIPIAQVALIAFATIALIAQGWFCATFVRPRHGKDL